MLSRHFPPHLYGRLNGNDYHLLLGVCVCAGCGDGRCREVIKRAHVVDRGNVPEKIIAGARAALSDVAFRWVPMEMEFGLL